MEESDKKKDSGSFVNTAIGFCMLAANNGVLIYLFFRGSITESMVYGAISAIALIVYWKNR